MLAMPIAMLLSGILDGGGKLVYRSWLYFKGARGGGWRFGGGGGNGGGGGCIVSDVLFKLQQQQQEVTRSRRYSMVSRVDG